MWSVHRLFIPIGTRNEQYRGGYFGTYRPDFRCRTYPFFESPREQDTYIQRRFERSVFQVENNSFIHYHLTSMVEHSHMLPRMIEILPGQFDEPINEYGHAGEEFVYVVEGILTLFIDHERRELYPGDIAHYPSTIIHNWANYTNKVVRILVVSSHNPFKLAEEV